MSCLSRIARRLLARLKRSSKGFIEEQRLQEYLNGYQKTSLVYLAAKLKVADLLADGPRNSRELAGILGADEASLARVLRAWAALGLCREEKAGGFSMTSMGKRLRSNREDSAYDFALLAGEEFAPAWNGLLHSVMTGEQAFNQVFGMSQWEHRKIHPDLNRSFNAWMGRISAHSTASILEAYDFSSCRMVADIGGGQGTLLASILGRHRQLEGILFDQADVVKEAAAILASSGVEERCRVIAGSFFDEMPFTAPVFILKSILHNWDDSQCLILLKRCHAAMEDKGTLLVIERMVSENSSDQTSYAIVDIQMLAVTGGRERSEKEYEGLLVEAGFHLEKVIPAGNGFFIMKASRE